jgi:hypothetical protein
LNRGAGEGTLVPQGGLPAKEELDAGGGDIWADAAEGGQGLPPPPSFFNEGQNKQSIAETNYSLSKLRKRLRDSELRGSDTKLDFLFHE